MQHHSFYSIYQHGFLRTAVCVPEVQLTRPADNARQILDLAAQAAQQGALVALFPELSLSAYSNDDLFHQDTLLDACEAALADVLAGSRQLACLLIVGAPLLIDGQLFICAVLIQQGQILGVVPKSYLPNYREFYEKRQFSAARQLLSREISRPDLFCAPIYQLPEYQTLIYSSKSAKTCGFPFRPAGYAVGRCQRHRQSVCNITIAKPHHFARAALPVAIQPVVWRLICILRPGPANPLQIWPGTARSDCENGELLAETDRFATTGQLIAADIDLERLVSSSGCAPPVLMTAPVIITTGCAPCAILVRLLRQPAIAAICAVLSSGFPCAQHPGFAGERRHEACVYLRYAISSSACSQAV
ncbi:MAG: nitrilase-related carbon-nitrogen hydrolase [Gammaproteobacteria bacterium]